MMHEEDRERCRRAMLALMRLTEGEPTRMDPEVISTLTVTLAIGVWMMQFEPHVVEDAVRDIQLMVDELQEPSRAYLH